LTDSLDAERIDKMSQVKSGLRLVALVLVAFVVGAMFFGGAGSLFSPSGHSRWLALVFLIVSIPIMILTMNRWVKVMAGFLGLAALNGLLSIWSGHVLGNPTLPISRLDALYLTVYYVIAATLTSTMKDRTLSLMDRISIMAFVFGLALLISYQAQLEAGRSAILDSNAFTLMGMSLCCLFAGWSFNLHDHRAHDPRSES